MHCASAIGSPAGTSDSPGFARNGFWKTDVAKHCIPFSEIVNGGPRYWAAAKNDMVGATRFVLFYLGGVAPPLDRPTTAEGADVGQAAFFDPTVDGRALTFRGGECRKTFLDDETASEWTITGPAITGRLMGRQLSRLPSDMTFWFIWAAFRPGTDVRAP